MGTVKTEITLKNAGDTVRVRDGYLNEADVRAVTVEAVVDTGAATLFINEEIRRKLALDITNNRQYKGVLADGSKQTYAVTEPVSVFWKDRGMTCEAVVIPNAGEALLGAIPLEALDLVVHPLRQELTGAHGDEIVYQLFRQGISDSRGIPVSQGIL
jgi:clan AA aspartic protease